VSGKPWHLEGPHSCEKAAVMPTIVDFPTVVKDALAVFGDVFDTEAARRHFAEYLTGLMVAENKTVSGINREFALTTDQSCLNRWLTEVQWDVTALNDRRLAWLQQAPQTRYSVRGVIAIDNTLVDHAGKLIEDVGWFWDHADERHVIAHDYMISNYVCPSKAHYPIEWRRFKKRDACPAQEFKDHTELCIELIDDALKRGIPGAFTFESYFTSAKVLNHLQSKQAAYVGDLKLNRKVVYAGREQKLQDMARQIPWDAKKPVRMGSTRYWYFSKQMRIPDLTHPVRIVLFWRERDDLEASKALVSNRLGWEVIRMVLVYRHRWTGTETFHRDGKQQLGLGDCQVRSGEGQTRHVYLVSAAYSLLMRSLQQSRAQDWARRTLTTIGEACRAVKAETLAQMIDWVVEKLTVDHWSITDIKDVLVYC
jgi:DDE superfamily endonuclease